LALGAHERLLAGRGPQRLRAARLEPAYQQLDVGGLVVDDEHAPEDLGRGLGTAAHAARLVRRAVVVVEEAREHRAELRRRIWLRDEVVAAGLDRPRAVLLHGEGRDGDDRDLLRPLLLTQQLRDGPAID